MVPAVSMKRPRCLGVSGLMCFMGACSWKYFSTLNIVNPKPINASDVRTPASMVRSAASTVRSTASLSLQFQFLRDLVIFVVLICSPTFFVLVHLDSFAPSDGLPFSPLENCNRHIQVRGSGGTLAFWRPPDPMLGGKKRSIALLAN